MGVSAGAGMIHYVLLTRDDLGRSVVDSRVIDVDPSDGLDDAGRVNAGIDVMLSAARENDTRVGAIGVAARTASQRRRLRSRGSGPKRQIRLTNENEAVAAYLADTGEIDRFAAPVVVDCGDTGMSIYTVDPAGGRIGDVERTSVISGRRLDRAIAAKLTADNPSLGDAVRTRAGRSELLSACRTAKEEISYGHRSSDEAARSSVTLPGGSGRVNLTESQVAEAVAPMIAQAREVFDRYVAEVSARGIAPDAVVFVGGLANLPAVREIARGHDLDTVCPSAPELVAATGAALLAHQTYSATTRLAFIGGRRQREWLSATPLAVAGAILAATLITIYAVSSSFADRNSDEAPPSISSVPAVATTGEQTPGTGTSSQEPLSEHPGETVTPTLEPTIEVPQPIPHPGGGAQPGWATTELPPTTPSTSTTTRTLLPFPWPDLPFAPETTPPIPPEVLPPELRPRTSAPQTSSDDGTSVAPRTGQVAPRTAEPAPGSAAPGSGSPASRAPGSAAPEPGAAAPSSSSPEPGVGAPVPVP
ncbi:Hsp70 family protein [Gordonia aurantiaca]|uniref:Hsp70 family protein n=1 Tax=Gordonia sp. B21 TaxID=3151852 RepID=UPI0032665B8F